MSQKVSGRDSAWISLGTSDWAHIVGRPKTKRNAVLWTLGAWFVWRRREEERPIAGFQPRGPSCTAHSLSHFFFRRRHRLAGINCVPCSLSSCQFPMSGGFRALERIGPSCDLSIA